MSRSLLAALILSLCCAGPTLASQSGKAKRPNVILIITDDQGHGDLGIHGNPKIRTPNLDKLARQGTRFTYFYVSPVCSPTRASLMTGRYNYRTGVVDTFLGRSLMHPDEVTLAQMLAAAGYRTGIFGKWHLGDNYPLRAMDRGFQESLVLKGGGIGQPSDPPGGDTYFDPVLYENGKAVKTKGYVSDVLTDAAIRFLERQPDGPFFVYLAFNAPHAPLQVPEASYQLYKKMNLAHSEFPQVGQPLPGKALQDVTARVYGMVTNIDDNIGRLLARLDELKLAEDTIVIFLTDNGPQQVRYNSGLRGRKGTVHEGGVRVPFFVRWPGKVPAGGTIDRIAAHIDVAPTLLKMCGVNRPAKVSFDGKSLWPLLRGDKIDWPDRTLYVQWHRGDRPELYRACAARSQQYRLVQPAGVTGEKLPAEPKFQLYDISKDPYEEHDFAAKYPEIIARMRKGYEDWFKDVSATRGYEPPRIHLGALEENPTLLTRQDWRGPRAGWKGNDLGHWEVQVVREGTYNVTLLFPASEKTRTARFVLGGVSLMREVPAAATRITFEAVRLPAGAGRLEGWLAAGDTTVGVSYVEVFRKE
ncbi:MAG TPA: arylsulfatase [Gemmataceae bacterium]|nr:arylsulfatase [Gemmataceae bacterium]